MSYLIYSLLVFIKSLFYLPWRLVYTPYYYLKSMGGTSNGVGVYLNNIIGEWSSHVAALKMCVEDYTEGTMTKDKEYSYFVTIRNLFDELDRCTNSVKQNITHCLPQNSKLRYSLQNLIQGKERLLNQYHIANLQNGTKELNDLKTENYRLRYELKLLKHEYENKIKWLQLERKKTQEMEKKVEVGSSRRQLIDDSFLKGPRKSETVFTNSNEITDSYENKSLAQMKEIRNEVNALKEQVDSFNGTQNDKEFLHLRELLLRNMIKLDDIETKGHLRIREKRREVIAIVKEAIENLKQKTET